MNLYTNLFVPKLDSTSYTVCYALPFIISSRNVLQWSPETENKTAGTDAKIAPTTSSEPHFPTKKELDDLIRYLVVTKSKESY